MQPLRQSTAQTILFGPCLDKGDGVTEETALTLAQADMRLSKDGGAFAQKSAAGNATHDSDGYYSTSLSTTDTATVGILRMNIHQPANMLPVWETFYVVEEVIYDAFYAASAPGYLQPTVAARTLDVTATGAAGIDWANVEGQATVVDLSATDIQLADTVTILTNLPAITANWLTDVGTDASFGTEVGTAVWATTARILTANTNLNDVSTGDLATALTDINLDHFVGTATGIPALPAGTYLDLLQDDGTAVYDRLTDSMQSIRDRGDASWTTGGGGSDRFLLVDTTITGLSTQLVFDLVAGSADDDAYNNCTIIVENASTATQKAVGMVLNYVGATKTVTLKEALAFTIANTDKVYIVAENSLKSTVANRQLDIASGGHAGLDLDNTVGTISAGMIASNAFTAAKFATDAFTADKFAPNCIGASELATDAIGEAQIATGAIISTTFGAGAIDNAAIATNALAAANFNSDAGAKLRGNITGTSDSGTTTTMVDNARTEADIDYWKGAAIRFTSGNIAGQTRIITGFVPATDTITFSPPVTNAVVTQTYELIEAIVDPWVRKLGNTTFSASAITQINAGPLAGKMSGLATTTATIRDIEDAANLIVATVDSDGNRSAVTITPPVD